MPYSDENINYLICYKTISELCLVDIIDVANKYEGGITKFKQNSMGIVLKRRDRERE